ncbi:MAG: hypothetical protein U5K69_23265 [Balneolaceae bacterium]|nr:hypothetical protein [Balneolaceae bacterium]
MTACFGEICIALLPTIFSTSTQLGYCEVDVENASTPTRQAMDYYHSSNTFNGILKN